MICSLYVNYIFCLISFIVLFLLNFVSLNIFVWSLEYLFLFKMWVSSLIVLWICVIWFELLFWFFLIIFIFYFWLSCFLVWFYFVIYIDVFVIWRYIECVFFCIGNYIFNNEIYIIFYDFILIWDSLLV